MNSSEIGFLLTLESIAACLQVAPGQMLFHRGDAATAIFAIEVGRVKLSRYVSNGTEVCLQVARAKEFFAEAALFSEVYHCDAIAELPSQVAVYSKQAILQNALREHLIDMNEVTLNAAVEERQVTGGLEMRITGTGRTAEAIEQLVPNQAQELDQLDDWQASTAPRPNSVRLTVTSADAQQVERIRALGFTGLLVSGGHHQVHHLALAKGMQMHSMQMRSLNSNCT